MKKKIIIIVSLFVALIAIFICSIFIFKSVNDNVNKIKPKNEIICEEIARNLEVR